MENDIMISVNLPYTKMIMDGIKEVEYRKEIIKDIRKGDHLYFYETKNKGGSGKIIGYANVVFAFPMHLINGKESDTIAQLYNEDMRIYINYAMDYLDGFHLCPDGEYIESIMTPFVQAYYDHLQKNILEKAIGIEKYLKKIGEGGNYAILFDEFIPCDLVLSDFISITSGKRMIHPPQNMSKVERYKSNEI